MPHPSAVKRTSVALAEGQDAPLTLTAAVALVVSMTGSAVPAGHYVLLQASGTGTHSESIVVQTEEVLG